MLGTVRLPAVQREIEFFPFEVSVKGFEKGEVIVRLVRLVFAAEVLYFAALIFRGELVCPLTKLEKKAQVNKMALSFCKQNEVPFLGDQFFSIYRRVIFCVKDKRVEGEDEVIRLASKDRGGFSQIIKIGEKVLPSDSAFVTGRQIAAQGEALFFPGVFDKSALLHLSLTNFMFSNLGESEFSLPEGSCLSAISLGENLFALVGIVKETIQRCIYVSRNLEKIRSLGEKLAETFKGLSLSLKEEVLWERPFLFLGKDPEENFYFVILDPKGSIVFRKEGEREDLLVGLQRLAEQLKGVFSFFEVPLTKDREIALGNPIEAEPLIEVESPSLSGAVLDFCDEDLEERLLHLSLQPEKEGYKAVCIDSLGALQSYPINIPLLCLAGQEGIYCYAILYNIRGTEKTIFLRVPFSLERFFSEGFPYTDLVDVLGAMEDGPIRRALVDLLHKEESFQQVYMDSSGRILRCTIPFIFPLQERGKLKTLKTTFLEMVKSTRAGSNFYKKLEEKGAVVSSYNLSLKGELLCWNFSFSSENTVGIASFSFKEKRVFVPALFSPKKGERVLLGIYPPYYKTCEEASLLARRLAKSLEQKAKTKNEKGETVSFSIKTPFILVASVEGGGFQLILVTGKLSSIISEKFKNGEEARKEAAEKCSKLQIGMVLEL